MKKILLLLCLFPIGIVTAQTMLNPGDIMVVGFNSTPSIDHVYFVPLVDLEEGTEFYITDNGYDGESGDLFTGSSGEDFVSIKTNQAVSKGTVLFLGKIADTSDQLDVSAVGGGDKYVKSISKTGDQVLIFQGTIEEPHFIFAITNRNADWETSAVDAGSILPSGLTNGTTALKFTHADNYALSTSVDLSSTNRAGWIERIRNSSNWSSSNASELTPPAGPLTVSSASSLSNSQTGNWEDVSTWNSNMPDTGTDVQIATGTVTVSSHVVVDDLTISSGASLVINAGYSLKVGGTLTNNAGAGGLVLKSDANGTAFLHHDTDNVQATVERFLKTGDWQYCTVPVTGTHNVETWFNDMYVIRFIESSGTWEYLNTGDEIQPMESVGVWPKSNQTVSFTGTLYNSDLQLPLKWEGTGSMKGYTMVGNPFVCPISWDATAVNRNNCNAGIHVWDGVAGNYKGYNKGNNVNSGSKYLAPGQGFFVRANANAANLGLGKAARKRAHVKFKAAETVEKMAFKLRVSGERFHDEVLLNVREQKTEIDQNEWGLTKIIPDKFDAPQFYINDEQQPYAIKSYASKDSLESIKMTLLAPTNEVLKISMVEFLHPDSLTPVLLKAEELNKEVDLRSGHMEIEAVKDQIINLEFILMKKSSSYIKHKLQVACYVKSSKAYFSNIPSSVDRLSLYRLTGEIVNTYLVSDSELHLMLPGAGSYIVMFESSGKLVQTIKLINLKTN
jgi:hypothetical protein